LVSEEGRKMGRWNVEMVEQRRETVVFGDWRAIDTRYMYSVVFNL
jgi:hypothetical protein